MAKFKYDSNSDLIRDLETQSRVTGKGRVVQVRVRKSREAMHAFCDWLQNRGYASGSEAVSALLAEAGLPQGTVTAQAASSEIEDFEV